jgi:hypothetical protein
MVRYSFGELSFEEREVKETVHPLRALAVIMAVCSNAAKRHGSLDDPQMATQISRINLFVGKAAGRANAPFRLKVMPIEFPVGLLEFLHTKHVAPIHPSDNRLGEGFTFTSVDTFKRKAWGFIKVLLGQGLDDFGDRFTHVLVLRVTNDIM